MTSGFTHEISTRGETNEWYTPPELFDKLKIKFDLDPCAPPEGALRTVPAKRYITQAEDGMRSRWNENENVFLNPPYGKQTGLWLGKLAMHGTGVALVFARTDTNWFHDTVSLATSVCFIKKRIRFVRPDGSRGGGSAAASCLIVFGDDNSTAIKASGLGMVLISEAKS